MPARSAREQYRFGASQLRYQLQICEYSTIAAPSQPYSCGPAAITFAIVLRVFGQYCPTASVMRTVASCPVTSGTKGTAAEPSAILERHSSMSASPHSTLASSLPFHCRTACVPQS